MPIRVVACVIERDGKLLLCRRPAHKRHGGMWEFPGGKIEEDEGDFDAVKRELAEELSLDALRVDGPAFVRADPDSDFVIEFFRVEIDGEPIALEHDELQWLTPAEAECFALAPADRGYVLFRLER